MREKGFAHILLIIFLLLGLVAGVYLVSSGNPLKLFSKAFTPNTQSKLINSLTDQLISSNKNLKPEKLSAQAQQINSMAGIASRRADELAKEAETDPAAFLVDAKLAWRKDEFPKEIQQYIEENKAIGGTLVLDHKDDLIGKKSTDNYYLKLKDNIQSKADMYRVFFADNSLVNGIGEPVFVNGVALNQKLVVRDSGSQNMTIFKQTPTNKKNPQNTALATQESQDVNILVLSYFPPSSTDPTQIDSDVVGRGGTVENIRTWTQEQNTKVVNDLTQSTRYHGYKDGSQNPYLNYKIQDSREFLKPVPTYRLAMFGGESNMSDYKKMLSTDVDVCDWVDNKGIGEVWIWSYQIDQGPNQIGINESNMSMGRNSQAFWNYSTYGDISNSYQLNDMPTCNKTYTMYNFNYGGGNGDGFMVHDYGHQLERVMRFVDYLTWARFINPYGSQTSVNSNGDTHHPPNTRDDYDYTNERTVNSNAEDWNPITTLGASKPVNCHTWSNIGQSESDGGACVGDTGLKFYLWWRQNIPGFQNQITYRSAKLRNWWEFMGDFDMALAKGKYLVEPLSLASNDYLGAWNQASVSFPAAVHENFGTVFAGNRVYILGGYGETSYNFPFGNSAQGGGGISNGSLNLAYSAVVDQSGNLGAWESTGRSLPLPLESMGAVESNGYIFVAGGISRGWSSNNVYSAKAESNGRLYTWQTLKPLPEARTKLFLIPSKGYLYVVGGYTYVSSPQQTYHKTIYRARVNTNGTFEDWENIGELPAAVNIISAYIHNDTLYAIGGINTTSFAAPVFIGKIDQDGSIQSWKTSNLIMPNDNDGSFIVNLGSYIFMLFGTNATSTTLLTTQIKENGEIDEWTKARDIPKKLMRTKLYKAGNNLYTLGGINGGGSVFTWNKDIVYSSINMPIEEPTPQPTPTPTPSPTATPTSTPAPSQAISLSAGNNFVGITVDKGSEYKVEDLAVDLNKNSASNVTQISRWKDGRWETHTVNFPTNNFEIKAGEGYLVNAIASSQVSLLGNKATLSSLRITPGWNSISLPTIPTSINTAEKLSNEMKNQGINLTTISRWKDGGWKSYIPGFPVGSFNLQAGEGYYLKNITNAYITFNIPPDVSTSSQVSVTTQVTKSSFSCTPCLADINKDKSVNMTDYSYWATCKTRGINSNPICKNADLDKDGKVGDKSLKPQDDPEFKCITSQMGKKC